MELTFTLLCPDVVMVSDFNNKIDRSTDLAKQGMVGGFTYKSDTVWGRLSIGCGRNLQRLQNSAAHIVQERTTTEEAFEMLGWINGLETQRIMHKCILVYKCLKNLALQF